MIVLMILQYKYKKLNYLYPGRGLLHAGVILKQIKGWQFSLLIMWTHRDTHSGRMGDSKRICIRHTQSDQNDLES